MFSRREINGIHLPRISCVATAYAWISSSVNTRKTTTHSGRTTNRSLPAFSAAGFTSRRSTLVHRASGGIPFLCASLRGATPSRTGLGSSGNLSRGGFKMPLGCGSGSLGGLFSAGFMGSSWLLPDPFRVVSFSGAWESARFRDRETLRRRGASTARCCDGSLLLLEVSDPLYLWRTDVWRG